VNGKKSLIKSRMMLITQRKKRKEKKRKEKKGEPGWVKVR
jgi:hypothetical protein